MADVREHPPRHELDRDRATAVRRSPVEHAAEVLTAAQAEVAKAIVGQDNVVELILIAMLARGHVLLEGPPGTGKTLLAQAMARLVGGQFKRMQFTADTTADEIVGRVRYRGGEAVFEPGIVFTNVLLADEINRAPARTQAALLEAMQERAVTVEGRTHWIKSPFFVLATQNPFEHTGVYALPESQLDRFLFRIDIEYGSETDDLAMLELPRRGVMPEVIGEVVPLLGDSGLILLQEAVDRVETSDEVTRTLVRLVRRTRELPGVVLGAGPRAMIHVLVAAKARAALRGASAATVEDVIAIARHALPHRIDAESSGATVVERAAEEVGALG